MKDNFFLILVFLAGGPTWAASQEIRFEDLPKLIAEKNPHVQIQRAQVEAEQTRNTPLVNSFLPELEAYAAEENFKMGSNEQKTQPTYGLQANVNLFRGGQDSLKNQIDDLNVKRSQQSLARANADRLLTARKLYWQLKFSRAYLEILSKSSETNQKNLKAALQRIRGGIASQSDRFEFEMKDIKLKKEVAETELNSKALQDQLAFELNLDKGTELIFPLALTHTHNFEEQLNTAGDISPVIYAESETDSELHKQKSKSLGREYWPRLDAYAAYDQYNELEQEKNPEAERLETRIGLRLTFKTGNLWSSTKEKSALQKEALIFQKKASIEKDQARLEVEKLWGQLKLMHDLVHDSEDNILRAQKYYQITQSEYQRGAKNSPDVLGASEKLLDAEKNRIEINRDFELARAEILFLKGL